MTARLPVEGLAVTDETARLDDLSVPPAEPVARRPAKPKSARSGAKRASATSSASPRTSPSPSPAEPFTEPADAAAARPGPARRTEPLIELLPDASAERASALGPGRLGELLPVPLTEGDVARIAEHQRAHGLRFGQAAVALRLATQGDVDWALSQQYGYAWVREGEYAGSSELVQAHAPFGAAAEAFRDLRAHLMNQPELARRPLAVVSAQAGDGRSFVAANLAIALSQLGANTLLVDADLRRPRQHSLFGLQGRQGLAGLPGPAEARSLPGLADLLAGRGERQVVRKVPHLPGLHVLPAGAAPPNPLELLQHPNLGVLLGDVVAAFDFVIVDTPAAAAGADARVVATACGAALAVARKDHTPMAALHDLAGSLVRLRAHLAGVVFNPA